MLGLARKPACCIFWAQYQLPNEVYHAFLQILFYFSVGVVFWVFVVFLGLLVGLFWFFFSFWFWFFVLFF